MIGRTNAKAISGSDPSIPVGIGQHLVTFYDFDGKVLKRQRVATGGNATAPDTPIHQHLTFAEWNNPFTNVQSDIDTGAIYNTTDGKTYLFITLTPVTGLAPTLYFYKSSNSLMTIDWGDGTTSTSTTSGNQTIQHTYASAGDYIITVDNSQGGLYRFGHGTYPITSFYGNQGILTMIFLGANLTTAAANQFTASTSLMYVSTGSYLTSYGNNSFQSTRIKHINVNSLNVSAEFYEWNNAMKIVDNVRRTNLIYFYKNIGLRGKLIFPSVTFIPANCFFQNINVEAYIFLSPTPPTLVNINAFGGINPICKIYVPDASVAAYKAATNWVNYSAYIYPLSEKPQSDE